MPALVVIDSVVRLLPGVLGHDDGPRQDSFADDAAGLLEGPQYTRPRVWRDRAVPEVLVGGDHARIKQWQHEQRLARTRTRRPDLLPE